MTAITCSFPPVKSLAFASPNAAEMEVELCPVAKASQSLSVGLGSRSVRPTAADGRSPLFCPSASYEYMPDVQRPRQFYPPADESSIPVLQSAPQCPDWTQDVLLFWIPSAKGTSAALCKAALTLFRLNSLYLQWNGYALKYRPQFHQLSILTTSKNLSEGSS